MAIRSNHVARVGLDHGGRCLSRCDIRARLLLMLIPCFGRDCSRAVDDRQRSMSTAIELMHAVGAARDALAASFELGADRSR